MPRPTRILVVMPSWVGDTVMATPALRALRRSVPGAFIGGLVRPGIEALLAGNDLLDEVHIDRAIGMMGPKRVAAKIRLRCYEAAILLTNSFSTALTTRLAGIGQRIGYDRDGRGLLLTDRLRAPLRRDTAPYNRSRTNPGDWAPIPACDYYFALIAHFLRSFDADPGAMGRMETIITADEAAAAAEVLASAAPGARRLAILNPGGNNTAKRWPADRFAALAAWLASEHGMTVLVSGAPAEAGLTAAIAGMVPEPQRERVIDLAAVLAKADEIARNSPLAPPRPAGLALLKAIIGRCELMVTNDTGPRHIAAGLNIPVVSLFGPTDHRWTAIPFERERIIVADPTLPEEEVANDHLERCAIERIGIERVMGAVSDLLRSNA